MLQVVGHVHRNKQVNSDGLLHDRNGLHGGARMTLVLAQSDDLLGRAAWVGVRTTLAWDGPRGATEVAPSDSVTAAATHVGN